MNYAWTLSGVGDRVLRLTRQQTHGGRPETVSSVLTVAGVCGRLRKSRRQVYRYLQVGRLHPCAQVLGQWLFAKAEVDRFQQTRVPTTLRPWFWDVSLANLAPDRHQGFILARLLELGDRKALAWVFRTYSHADLVAFLKGRGAEVLSRRTWNFWAGLLAVKASRRPTPAWRARGRHWGGLDASTQ